MSSLRPRSSNPLVSFIHRAFLIRIALCSEILPRIGWSFRSLRDGSIFIVDYSGVCWFDGAGYIVKMSWCYISKGLHERRSPSLLLLETFSSATGSLIPTSRGNKTVLLLILGAKNWHFFARGTQSHEKMRRWLQGGNRWLVMKRLNERENIKENDLPWGLDSLQDEFN